jgi:hypothetical protein
MKTELSSRTQHRIEDKDIAADSQLDLSQGGARRTPMFQGDSIAQHAHDFTVVFFELGSWPAVNSQS